MDGEVLDIDTQAGMVQQPVIQLSVASKEEEGGQEQEWRCGEHGQECSQYSQRKCDAAQYGEDVFHDDFISGRKDAKYVP